MSPCSQALSALDGGGSRAGQVVARLGKPPGRWSGLPQAVAGRGPGVPHGRLLA